MPRRKEQKALRRERLERERAAAAAERRRRLIGYGVGGALALAAVVIVIVLLVVGGGDSSSSASVYPLGGKVPPRRIGDLSKAAPAADCTMTSKPANSRQHIFNQSQTVHYSTNPPTSGRHYQFPADDRAYTDPPPVTMLVHALEHGRVIIWWRPGTPRSVLATLKALYDKNRGYHLILVKNETGMPYEVATSAWDRNPVPLGTGYLMGCSRVGARTYDAIQDFYEAHQGNGPEPVP